MTITGDMTRGNKKCIQKYGCKAQENRLLWRAKKRRGIDITMDFEERV
jgi:hypothetical protein